MSLLMSWRDNQRPAVITGFAFGFGTRGVISLQKALNPSRFGHAALRNLSSPVPYMAGDGGPHLSGGSHG